MFIKNIKYLYYLAVIISCAVVVHLGTIFYYAYFSRNKPYTSLKQYYPEHKFTVLSTDDKWLNKKDSYFNYYICPFSIRHRALHVMSSFPSNSFWSLAFYNYHGELVYSLNSYQQNTNDINLLLSTQRQLSLINKYGDMHNATYIARNIENGFAILKIFATNKAEVDFDNNFIKNTICQPLN